MSEIRAKSIIAEAKQTLSTASYSPAKLSLIHIGISSIASVVVTVIAYLCQSAATDGGLSNLGNQALLETIETVLPLLLNIFSIFWSMSFVSAALGLARGQDVRPSNLRAGFDRWGAIVRMYLVQGILYFTLMYGAIIVGSTIYSLSPASSKLMELMEQFQTADADVLMSMLESLDEATIMELLYSMLPFVLIPLALVMIPVAYRLRFSSYLLMDTPRSGAFASTFGSFRLTRKNWRHILALDLRFWWYYALEMLIALLAYGDILLPLLGIALPFDSTAASFVFYALALVAQMGLYTWKRPLVMSSYALLYDRILSEATAQA